MSHKVRGIGRAGRAIPFDHGVRGNRHGDEVALGGVGEVRDEDLNLRRAAIDDVDRDAVEGVIGGRVAEVGVNSRRGAAVVGRDAADDGGGVCRDRRVGDDLIPGIVEREDLVPEERGNSAGFQFEERECHRARAQNDPCHK